MQAVDTPSYWGTLEPVEWTVRWDHRKIPVKFNILDDTQEERILIASLTSTLDLPPIPPCPATVPDVVWMDEIGKEINRLREQQKSRLILAHAIHEINGQSFGQQAIQHKLAQIAAWPGRLIDECLAAYINASKYPSVLLDEMEQDAGFAEALPESGLSPSSAVESD